MVEKVSIGNINLDEQETAKRFYSHWCGFRRMHPYRGKQFAGDVWGAMAGFQREKEEVVGSWSIKVRAKENVIILYLDARSERYSQQSMVDYVLLQKQCSLEPMSVEHFAPVLVHPMTFFWKGPVYRSEASIIERRDRRQKFEPSERLVEVISNHMAKVDENALKLFAQLEKIRPAALKKQNLKMIVSDKIENLLTEMAKRVSLSGESLRIISDKRFSSDICKEIIDRLELDSYNPTPVLDLLYRELIDFALYLREREWGNFYFEDADIKLLVKDDAFKMPVLDSIDGKLWTSI